MVFAAATVSASLVSAMKSGTAYFGGSPGAPLIVMLMSPDWRGGAAGGCASCAASASAAEAAKIAMMNGRICLFSGDIRKRDER